uniref:Uncharacterized protein n=1 Tax=Rhizophagus irregularis (strain DAOM 181602 / DAOM 197198 / MUCL 43194) TaxID=747089 RepID=U9UBV8_RHIID
MNELIIFKYYWKEINIYYPKNTDILFNLLFKFITLDLLYKINLLTFRATNLL